MEGILPFYKLWDCNSMLSHLRGRLIEIIEANVFVSFCTLCLYVLHIILYVFCTLFCDWKGRRSRPFANFYCGLELFCAFYHFSFKWISLWKERNIICIIIVLGARININGILFFFQVKISSAEEFKVVVISEESNCHNAKTLLAFLKCLINNIWQMGVSNETFVAVDQYGDKKCFQVHPISKHSYTVNAQQNSE